MFPLVHTGAHSPTAASSKIGSLNVDGLSFPMQTKEITLFEQQNSDISVNVLYYDACSSGFCVEYMSRHRARRHQVNLLLLDEADSNKITSMVVTASNV